MDTNLKKLIPVLGIVFLGMTDVNAAYNDKNNSTKDNGANAKMMSVPPSPSPGDSGPNVFISADYTLWTAREAGLAVGVSQANTAGGAGAQGQVYYPNGSSELRSGFKVDLGVYLPHDNWDLIATYTWFSNNNNSLDNITIVSGQTVSTGTAYDTAAQVTSLSALWNNWFQRVDATMGRAFFAGHYLALRPFMGLIGAWDSQDLDVTTNLSTSTNHQTWWGVGPYTGVDSVFTFWSSSSDQWSLFMNIGFGTPWSKFTATETLVAETDDAADVSTQSITETIAPMIDSTIGLRWEMWWSDGAWKFLLQAGWEQQVWFNHNNFVTLRDTVYAGNGAYTMQGLTIRALIAF